MTTRYPQSVEPIRTDGRDIDTRTAVLSGEAANQVASGSTSKDLASKAQTWTRIPEPVPEDPTYYDRPMLQASVWTWAIPTYYYVGGLAGSALVLAAALQLKNAREHKKLIRRCHIIAVAGTMLSGALLIYDLGRPMRFLNMLRVFRPTSVMNMGAWILSGSGAMASGALLLERTPLGGPIGVLAGILGLGLATYTGVLASVTAVPLWFASRRVLPLLFGASALTSLGSFFDLIYDTPATRTLGNLGRAGELAASVAMERQASEVEYVGRPLKRGFSGFLWRTAAVLTASSLAVSLLPKSKASKGSRIAAGVLGTAGSLILRFAVEHAGNMSARDPRSTIRMQRSGR